MLAELANTADNETLLRLLQENPISGAITVGFERSPNYFAASALGAEESHSVVIREPASGCIACVGDVSVRRVFINGKCLRAAYLSSWRVDRPWRVQTGLLDLGLRRIAELQRERLGADIFYSTIVSDNAPARRLLERRVSGLAAFHTADELVTFLIRTRPGSDWQASNIINTDDFDELSDFLSANLAQFQFTSDWNSELSSQSCDLEVKDFCVIRRGGRICAAGAVWDQRSAKQVVVHGYARQLGMLRPLYNVVATPTGRPLLPSPGSPLAIASVAGFSVPENDPKIAVTLIDALRKSGVRERGIEILALTLSRRHPAIPAIQRSFRPWAYRSLIYQVGMPGTLPPEHLEPERMAQPEAALL